MKEESHKDIAIRMIIEFKQDPKSFKKKYSYRSDIDKIIDLFNNKVGQEQYTEFASRMDLVEDNPTYVLNNLPETFAMLAPIMVSRLNTFDHIGIIQKVPTKFNEWRDEIDSYFGKTKIRKIKELVHDYDILLNGGTYTNDSQLNAAFNEVKDELIEQQQYWISELQKLQMSENPEVELEETTDLKKKIKNAFGFMLRNDPRKHIQILSETDFDKLTEWINYYFENDFTLPKIDKAIRFARTNKGNVVWAFLTFFKGEYPTAIYPKSIFELIKLCFHEYREDKISNLKKTTRPKYFDDLYIK